MQPSSNFIQITYRILFLIFISIYLHGEEYFELKIYHIDNVKAQKATEAYIEKALIPALNRAGLKDIGAFKKQTPEGDLSLFMIISYPSIDQFTGLHEVLEKDKKYQKSAVAFFSADKKNPFYLRADISLMKAFAGMPKLNVPSFKKSKSRIFELRTYESVHENNARKKVKMFNEGEIDAMKESGLNPVFYGETLASGIAPNLSYMTCAESMEEHKKHWENFKVNPIWQKLKKMPEFKGLVSKSHKYLLIPLKCSQL